MIGSADRDNEPTSAAANRARWLVFGAPGVLTEFEDGSASFRAIGFYDYTCYYFLKYESLLPTPAPTGCAAQAFSTRCVLAAAAASLVTICCVTSETNLWRRSSAPRGESLHETFPTSSTLRDQTVSFLHLLLPESSPSSTPLTAHHSQPG